MRSNTYTDEQLKYVVEIGKTAISWQEATNKFNKKFNLSKTRNAVRKLFNVWQDHDFTNDSMLKNIRSAHTVRKLNSKLRNENNVILDELLVKDQFLEQFEVLLSKNPLKIHKPVKTKKKKKYKRTIFAHLSDNHIHAMIDGEEMGGMNQYGATEEARRLAYFVREVAQ